MVAVVQVARQILVVTQLLILVAAVALVEIQAHH